MKAGFATDAAPEPGKFSAQPRFTPPRLSAIAQLFPQLEVLELLGRGGMGAVYLARHPALNRLIALKILPPESTQRTGFVERFTREAQALAKLNHPNIVAVHDFGEAGGMPYFLMEFVEGITLRQLVQQRRLEPREALQIVPQICDALQYAHDEGVVHRDIKPENILIDRKGRVKIADFGIAKILGNNPAQQNLTQSQVLGTPYYMAPEQVENPEAVDHRADIYSLGVVFYEMLTRELPLGRFAPPSSKVQVDVRLDEVVLRALDKEPQRRYQHVSDLKTDVQALTNQPGHAKDPRFLEEQVRELATLRQKRRWLLWYSLVACLAGVPIGIALNLPYVWGLSIGGGIVAARKLELLGTTPSSRAGGTPPAGCPGHRRQSWFRLTVSIVGLLAGLALNLPIVWGLSLCALVLSAHAAINGVSSRLGRACPTTRPNA
jgi:predicted Ser/Thr protein kinase